jgi:hypothetical protein
MSLESGLMQVVNSPQFYYFLQQVGARDSPKQNNSIEKKTMTQQEVIILNGLMKKSSRGGTITYEDRKLFNQILDRK